MKIVITGASGNVGTALLHQLAGQNHRIVGIARRRPQMSPPYDVVERWRCLDLGEPKVTSSLADTFAAADVVVHLAWGFQPSRDREYLRRTGVDGTAHVVDAIIEAGVPHLVHMSSGAVYSPVADDRSVTEDSPRGGIEQSAYSVDKVAVESYLDARQRSTTLAIARLRPGLIGQRSFGSALLRYGTPPGLPPFVLRALPVLPIDRSLAMPVVHADDVADAIVRVIERRATGAFNLAAEPAIGPKEIGRAFNAAAVHFPWRPLAGLVEATFRTHLQSVPRGWVDLAFKTPMLDCTRARTELGWKPEKDAQAVMDELIAGVLNGVGGDSPVLRPRRVREELRTLVREGSVSRRRLS